MSLGLQGDQISQSQRKPVMDIHWKDWCWSWNCNTLATWCKELNHWKTSWCSERLKAGGEWDNRGWDGWMASRTRWTWVCASSGSWWWTGTPDVLQSVGSQRVGQHWVTEMSLIPKGGKKVNVPTQRHLGRRNFLLFIFVAVVVVPFKTSTNWTRPIYIRESNLLYSVYQFDS